MSFCNVVRKHTTHKENIEGEIYTNKFEISVQILTPPRSPSIDEESMTACEECSVGSCVWEDEKYVTSEASTAINKFMESRTYLRNLTELDFKRRWRLLSAFIHRQIVYTDFDGLHIMLKKIRTVNVRSMEVICIQSLPHIRIELIHCGALSETIKKVQIEYPSVPPFDLTDDFDFRNQDIEAAKETFKIISKATRKPVTCRVFEDLRYPGEWILKRPDGHFDLEWLLVGFRNLVRGLRVIKVEGAKTWVKLCMESERVHIRINKLSISSQFHQICCTLENSYYQKFELEYLPSFVRSLSSLGMKPEHPCYSVKGFVGSSPHHYKNELEKLLDGPFLFGK